MAERKKTDLITVNVVVTVTVSEEEWRTWRTKQGKDMSGVVAAADVAHVVKFLAEDSMKAVNVPSRPEPPKRKPAKAES